MCGHNHWSISVSEGDQISHGYKEFRMSGANKTCGKEVKTYHSTEEPVKPHFHHLYR